ncbi:hypothetical protein NMY22_g19175 [Coprinellus aureogranulatus]|nr:hypothetical protein NMY22_g19175 [Coprinellus aureogranulatus]
MNELVDGAEDDICAQRYCVTRTTHALDITRRGTSQEALNEYDCYHFGNPRRADRRPPPAQHPYSSASFLRAALLSNLPAVTVIVKTVSCVFLAMLTRMRPYRLQFSNTIAFTRNYGAKQCTGSSPGSSTFGASTSMSATTAAGLRSLSKNLSPISELQQRLGIDSSRHVTREHYEHH